MKSIPKELMDQLQHRFSNQEYLHQALQHRSAGDSNNERLEFLGDSVLNLIVAHSLFQRFPTAKEGQLSRLRASVVCGESLAALAKKMNLGSYIEMGSGELRSGGRQRASVLADCLEAVIAAIYLDGGYAAAETVVLSWFGPQLEEISLKNIQVDNKTQLQEYLQSKRLPLPEYRLIEVTGLDHALQFRVECRVSGFTEMGEATASTRRYAEQQAAKELLEKIRHE